MTPVRFLSVRSFLCFLIIFNISDTITNMITVLKLLWKSTVMINDKTTTEKGRALTVGGWHHKTKERWELWKILWTRIRVAISQISEEKFTLWQRMMLSAASMDCMSERACFSLSSMRTTSVGKMDKLEALYSHHYTTICSVQSSRHTQCILSRIQLLP